MTRQSMRPTDENWSCGFEPAPETFVCGKTATWHGFRLSEDGSNIDSMMASCDDHKVRMEANADYVHAMAHSCGLPGSRFVWPENYCYTDWYLDTLTAEAALESVG